MKLGRLIIDIHGLELSKDDIDLLKHPDDKRIKDTDFGTYTNEKFSSDLLNFNDGRPLSPEQNILVSKSFETIQCLASHKEKIEPIYSSKSFLKDVNGLPRKSRFGAWVRYIFVALTKLKSLRGTSVDPFSYSQERKLEVKFKNILISKLSDPKKLKQSP